MPQRHYLVKGSVGPLTVYIRNKTKIAQGSPYMLLDSQTNTYRFYTNINMLQMLSGHKFLPFNRLTVNGVSFNEWVDTNSDYVADFAVGLAYLFNADTPSGEFECSYVGRETYNSDEEHIVSALRHAPTPSTTPTNAAILRQPSLLRQFLGHRSLPRSETGTQTPGLELTNIGDSRMTETVSVTDASSVSQPNTGWRKYWCSY